MEERFYYTKEGEKYGPFSLKELTNEGISDETLIWYHGLQDWTPAKDIEVVKNALIEASLPPLPIDMDEDSEVPPLPTDMAEDTEVPPPFPTDSDKDAEVPPPFPTEETTPKTTLYDSGKQTADVEQTHAATQKTKTESAQKTETEVSVVQEQSFFRRHIVGILTTVSIVVLLFIMALTCPNENDHKVVISNLASDVASDILADETGSDLAGFGASLLLPNLTDKLFSQFFKVHNCGLFSYCEYDFNGNKKLVSIGAFGHVFTTNSDQVRKMLRESRHRR